MIRLQVDTKVLGGRLLYRDFRLELAAGELVCLLGRSGCGKTSLLNLLAGLDRNFRGQVAGLDVSRLGYLFQEPRLLPWCTLTENLLLVAPEASTRAEALLAELELDAWAHCYPGQLSLGMARRVALARALMVAPQLLLLDEPFVSLDPPTALAMQGILQRVRQRHPETAILMVSHDVREALSLADRVLVLGGRPTQLVKTLTPKARLAGEAALCEHQIQALLEAYALEEECGPDGPGARAPEPALWQE